jgi:hypothetical protein
MISTASRMGSNPSGIDPADRLAVDTRRHSRPTSGGKDPQFSWSCVDQSCRRNDIAPARIVAIWYGRVPLHRNQPREVGGYVALFWGRPRMNSAAAGFAVRCDYPTLGTHEFVGFRRTEHQASRLAVRLARFYWRGPLPMAHTVAWMSLRDFELHGRRRRDCRSPDCPMGAPGPDDDPDGRSAPGHPARQHVRRAEGGAG